ncbi:hypothetical protein [Xanthomonas phage JGB6]|nr:hypothetical protein [Xanthomonas phage JGB6]
MDDTELRDRILKANGNDMLRMMNEVEKIALKRKDQLYATLQRSDANKTIFNEKSFVEGNAERISDSINKITGKYQELEVKMEETAKKGNWNQEKLNEERNKMLLAQTQEESAAYDQKIGILSKSSRR